MARLWELLDDEGTVRFVPVNRMESPSLPSNEAAASYALEQAIMGDVAAREAIAEMVNSWAGDLLRLKDGEIKYDDQRLPGAVGRLMDVVGRHGKFEDMGRVDIKTTNGENLTRHILRVFEDGIEVDNATGEGNVFIPLRSISYIVFPKKGEVL